MLRRCYSAREFLEIKAMTLSIRAALAVVAALFTAETAQAAERTVTLDVTNVSCVTCAPIVRRAISRVPGVTAVSVNPGDAGRAVATVTYDDVRVTPTVLAQASTNAGYPARVRASH